MARVRNSHEAKSPEERKQYIRSTIKNELDPTVETIGIGEATDAISAASSQPQINITPEKRKFFDWFHADAQTIGGTLLVILLGGTLAWLSSVLFSLNREVGELRSTISQLPKQLEQIENTIKDASGKSSTMKEVLDRNVTKIEELEKFHGIIMNRLLENHPGGDNQTPPNTKTH